MFNRSMQKQKEEGKSRPSRPSGPCPQKKHTQTRLGVSEEDVYFFCVPNVDDRKHKDKQSKCWARPLCHLLSQGTSLLDPTEGESQSLATFGTVRHRALASLSLFFFSSGMLLRTIALKESTGTGACAWLNRWVSQCPSFLLRPHFFDVANPMGPRTLTNQSFLPEQETGDGQCGTVHLGPRLAFMFRWRVHAKLPRKWTPMKLTHFCLCRVPTLSAHFFHRLSRPHPMKRYLPVHFFS